MLNTIVVGFDGSDTSERAMTLACDLAQKFGSALHVVHAPQPQTVAYAMGAMAGYHAVTTMPAPEDVAASNAKIIAAAGAIAAKAGVEVVQSHVEMADPADVIVRYGETCGADLIVTGRRGLGALGSLVQGSTSLRVNHLAKCAVLTVV